MRGSRSNARRAAGAGALVGACALLALAAGARSARAHSVGLSRGDYCLRDGSLGATLVFSRTELAQLDPALDANHDGTISGDEVAAAGPLLRTRLVSRIDVTSGSAACEGALELAEVEEEDGLLVRLRWRCPGPAAGAKVDLPVLDDLPFGHRHIAQVVSGTGSTVQLAFRENRSFMVPPAPGPCPVTRNLAVAVAEPAGGGRGFGLFPCGAGTILTRWPHLAFLVGLLVVGGRLRTLGGVIAAFGAGAAITLVYSAVRAVAPPAAIVDPAVALSVAYIGIENFFVKDAANRWRVALPFGLVHGFAFAGMMQGHMRSGDDVLVALSGFSLGLAAALAAILGAAFALAFQARRRRMFGDYGVAVASGALVVAGGYGFVAGFF